MERQNEYRDNNFLELMLLNLGVKVNDFAKSNDNLEINVPNQADNASSLSYSFHCQTPPPPPPSNFYEFLTENSSILQKAAPTHVFDTISAPSMSEFQTQLLMYHNPGLSSSSGSKSAVDMDAWKLNPHLYMFNNSDNNESLPQLLNCSEQHDEVKPLKKFNTSQAKTEIHSSFTQAQSGATTSNVSRSRPKRKVAAYNLTRQRAYSTERKRREKLALKVKALQELLPRPVEVHGSQAATMDEIIEYVKYLQLKIKELSRKKLGVDSGSCPSIFNEVDNHHHHHHHHHDYSFNGQTMNEPPGEMLEKVLKVDKSVAFKLLEKKGLYMMPMALAHSLE